MKTSTWAVLFAVCFIISPVLGGIVCALYVFNYVTAIIFDRCGIFIKKIK